MIKLLQFLLPILQGLFSRKPATISAPPAKPAAPAPQPQVSTTSDSAIDWTNPKSKISKYFNVGDALSLRNWNRLANESDGLNDKIKENILTAAKKMDVVREFINKPVLVKSWLRPSAYNISIGGAAKSAHMEGLAVDLWTDQDGDGNLTGQDCDLLKETLMPKLEEWELRMEDNGKGARWVHLDLRPVIGKRFFKP